VGARAFRPSALFLGIVAIFGVSGWLLWQPIGNPRLDVFLFVTAGWVVSLCLHEYAHALTAYHGGDRGVAARGYLRLDPLKYSHPVLSILLPLLFLVLGGIGLPGGAVYVDRNSVRGRRWDSLISFAGPAVNLGFALLLITPFWFIEPVTHAFFWAGVAFLAFLQLTATVLNLLPIPGTDGGNLIEPWLSAQWQRGYRLVAPYGLLLLLALLWQLPLLSQLFFGAVNGIANALGLPSDFAGIGRTLYQFWG